VRRNVGLPFAGYAFRAFTFAFRFLCVATACALRFALQFMDTPVCSPVGHAICLLLRCLRFTFVGFDSVCFLPHSPPLIHARYTFHPPPRRCYTVDHVPFFAFTVRLRSFGSGCVRVWFWFTLLPRSLPIYPFVLRCCGCFMGSPR